MIQLPDKKYNIIYADPPWAINALKQVPSGRANTIPYRAIRQCDIFKLNIQKIVANNCILFLWGTMPLLPEALFCINSWGFEYKTVAFTWVKKNKKSNSWFFGMGSWTRSNAEYCLLGIKGNPKRINASISSVIDNRIEEHSKKPDIVRDKIVELCGDLPRIELFARQKTEGWDVWGNEV